MQQSVRSKCTCNSTAHHFCFQLCWNANELSACEGAHAQSWNTRRADYFHLHVAVWLKHLICLAQILVCLFTMAGARHVYRLTTSRCVLTKLSCLRAIKGQQMTFLICKSFSSHVVLSFSHWFSHTHTYTHTQLHICTFTFLTSFIGVLHSPTSNPNPNIKTNLLTLNLP